jgi:carbon storage regulator
MLILTRRIGESVTIGEDAEIVVTMLNIRGQQAKIGISAPQEIIVHRDEVFKRIQKKKQES